MHGNQACDPSSPTTVATMHDTEEVTAAQNLSFFADTCSFRSSVSINFHLSTEVLLNRGTCLRILHACSGRPAMWAFALHEISRGGVQDLAGRLEKGV
jgi:hypothetical protein